MFDFDLSRTARQHVLDDVQELLIKDVTAQFQALWPADGLKAPHALMDLFEAIDVLIDYTSRSPRGRAHMRKRLLLFVSNHMEEAKSGDSSLLNNPKACAIVPSLLATLRSEDEAELAQELAETDSTVLALAVEAWLQAGGDNASETE